MRPRITAATWGTLYLLHFDRPIGNAANRRALAGHYVGFALDVEERLAQHAKGQGAALTKAAVAAGVTWEVFLRPGPLALEKWLKARKETPRFCPVCCAARGRPCHPLFIEAQLALDFDGPLDDFEPIPPGRNKADWLEWTIARSWRRPLPLLAKADDGADIPW